MPTPTSSSPFAMQSTGEHGFIGMMVTLVPIATITAVAVMLRQWPTPRQWIGVLGGLGCRADRLRRLGARHRRLAARSSPSVRRLATPSATPTSSGSSSHLPTAPLTVLFLLMGAALVVPFEFIPALRDGMHLGPPDETPQHFWYRPRLAVAPGRRQHRRRDLALRLARPNAGPLFAGMVTYVVPMIALLWGQFDGERLTSRQLAAIAGALAMVAIVQWRAAKPVVAATAEPPA